MAMLPSRVKHRKQHTRGWRLDHVAQTGNRMAFGEYGLQVLESGGITARQLEAARVAAAHYLGRSGKLWIRIFPHHPVGKHPAESRMGSGKGDVSYWSAFVDGGTVVFELAGVTEDQAREAFRRQSFKLPLRCRMIKREAVPA